MKEITWNDVALCLTIFVILSGYQARKSWRWQEANVAANVILAALPLLRKVDWQRLA